MTVKEIEELLDNYPAKQKLYGFTDSEIKDIASKIPDINMQKVYRALFGNTCMVIGEDVVNYYHDVKLALVCGVQNRDLKVGEWD